MSGVWPERLAHLLAAAEKWRASVNSFDLPEVRQMAEVTARNLEREAETGIAACACCNKPFGRGTFSLS